MDGAADRTLESTSVDDIGIMEMIGKCLQVVGDGRGKSYASAELPDHLQAMSLNIKPIFFGGVQRKIYAGEGGENNRADYIAMILYQYIQLTDEVIIVSGGRSAVDDCSSYSFHKPTSFRKMRVLHYDDFIFYQKNAVRCNG